MAEAARFELAVRCRTTVFKTAALSHSATLPFVLAYWLGFEPRKATLEVAMLPITSPVYLKSIASFFYQNNV